MRLRPVDNVAVSNESPSACSTSCRTKSSPSWPHGARRMSPSSGRTSSARPITPRARMTGCRRSRGREACMLEDLTCLIGAEVVDERLSCVGVRCLGKKGDRIVVDHLLRLRHIDAFHRAPCCDDVGHVDQCGVGLTQRDFSSVRHARPPQVCPVGPEHQQGRAGTALRLHTAPRCRTMRLSAQAVRSRRDR